MYRDGITWIFRALCCASTAFMVGYWLYKYQKDEDLSVIEYRVLQGFSEDVIYPDTTICAWSPLIGDRFDVTGKNNVTHVEYQEYLYGERNFEEKFLFMKKVLFLKKNFNFFAASLTALIIFCIQPHFCFLICSYK